MLHFLRLVQNELEKSFLKISVILMIGMIVLGVLAVAITKTDQDTTQKSWVYALQSKNADLEAFMQKHPEIPTRVSGYYKQIIQINHYRIQNNMLPSNAADFMNSSLSINILIELLIVIIAASMIGNEFSFGTIKFLLIRPRSRRSILLSKFIALVLIFACMLAVLFITTILTAALKYGFSQAFLPRLAYQGGRIVEVPILQYLLEQFAIFSVQPMMIMTMTFMLAVLTRNTAIATGIPLFLSFTSTIITDKIAKYAWSKYFIFTNTNFSQYVSGQVYHQGMTVQFSILVLLVYFMIFMSISFTYFDKKDVLV